MSIRTPSKFVSHPNHRFHEERPGIATSWLLALAAASTLALALGCSGEPRRIRRPSDRAAAQTVADSENTSFADGSNMLFNLVQFDSDAGATRCATHFNQWIESAPTEKDWAPDPMIAELPKAWRESTGIEGLRAKHVSEKDVEFMEYTMWLRNIVRWAGASEEPTLYDEWFAERAANDDIDKDGDRQLQLVNRLFDWTIRNIQLRRPGPKVLKIAPNKTMKWYGQATLRWAILYGEGDLWQRTRVFLGLCRQAELTAFMLGVREGEKITPWCPAVMIGDDIYLFDTMLGLPLPGEGDRGIATLKQLRENPKLLEGLTLSDDLAYLIQKDMLEDVVALLDVNSEQLSLRMAMIEKRLTGDQRLALTVKPSEVRKRLEKQELSVEIWDHYLSVLEEVRAHRVAMRKSPAYVDVDRRLRLVFVGSGQVITGRKLHLNGGFTIEDGRPGAKQQYMSVRFSDDTIARIDEDRELLQRLGAERDPDMPAEVWGQILNAVRIRMREEKIHVSFWIGLVHFEEGRYTSATQWFQKRVLEEAPNSVWSGAARYNLARSQERLGQFSQARDLYLQDTSLQRHGNFLRARILKSLALDQSDPANESEDGE